MNILIIGSLSEDKFVSKTRSLVENNKVERVFIFRFRGCPYLDKKVTYLKINPLLKYLPNSLSRFIYDAVNLLYYSVKIITKQIHLIVGLYLYPYGFYTAVLGLLFNVPTILILPGSDLKRLHKTKKHLKIFKHAAFWGVRGCDSKKKLVSLGILENKTFILPNVFDINDYKHNHEKIPSKKYDLVFTGYLRKGKRVDVVLKIVFLLKSTFPNIKCLIVGDGSEKENLKKLSNELNLNSNVDFINYSTSVMEYLAVSKIFILTSESEGLPMSMIEAMSIGLPVVVSNINDIPDIVKHGHNGFLVEVGDVNNYVKFCTLLLSDESFREKIGNSANKTIENLYIQSYSGIAVYNTWDKILCMINNVVS